MTGPLPMPDARGHSHVHGGVLRARNMWEGGRRRKVEMVTFRKEWSGGRNTSRRKRGPTWAGGGRGRVCNRVEAVFVCFASLMRHILQRCYVVRLPLSYISVSWALYHTRQLSIPHYSWNYRSAREGERRVDVSCDKTLVMWGACRHDEMSEMLLFARNSHTKPSLSTKKTNPVPSLHKRVFDMLSARRIENTKLTF